MILNLRGRRRRKSPPGSGRFGADGQRGPNCDSLRVLASHLPGLPTLTLPKSLTDPQSLQKRKYPPYSGRIRKRRRIEKWRRRRSLDATTISHRTNKSHGGGLQSLIPPIQQRLRPPNPPPVYTHAELALFRNAPLLSIPDISTQVSASPPTLSTDVVANAVTAAFARR